MEISLILAFFTVFLFGLRHGLDNDHIATIFSLTATIKTTKKETIDNRNRYGYVNQFNNAFSYIFGHAVVVVILGLLIIGLGFTLPKSFDSIFERIIGLSLIVLGIYVICTIFINKLFKKDKTKVIIKSRLELFQELFFGKVKKNISPFFLGMIHGIGAETPSQLLLLIIVGGLQGIYSFIALAIFVVGLVISNTIL